MKLLIGYGNTLRRDDGAGWWVAAELMKLHPPPHPDSDLKIITAHQLMPEMAAEMAQAERVIFVDASADGIPGTVLSCKLRPLHHIEDAHALTAHGLMYLTRYLYVMCPPSYLVTVTGASFELGDTLTIEVRRSLPRAVAAVHQLLAGDSW